MIFWQIARFKMSYKIKKVIFEWEIVFKTRQSFIDFMSSSVKLSLLLVDPQCKCLVYIYIS